MAIFAHYRTYHPRAMPTPSPSSKEWKLICQRLQEGYTVADLNLAIDGCHRSPFHQGENDRGTKYLDLELIVRNGSNVNRFMEKAQGPEPVISEKERRNHRAGDAWLERMERKDTLGFEDE